MQLIDGVTVKRLRLAADNRGFLMELLRRDWPEFGGFAQSYVAAVYPGVVKAWHAHERQWDILACVSGMATLVLYDSRPESQTHGQVNEFHLGLLNPLLVCVPPRVYHGFTAIGPEKALLVNFPSELYDGEKPDELRLPADDPTIPYQWGRVSR